MGGNLPKEVDVRPEYLLHYTRVVDWCYVARVTIDKLPDVALLETFHFFMEDASSISGSDTWRRLLHVCRKWRNVIFGSPHRLDLHLHCREWTRVRETIAAWPLLPIHVEGYAKEKCGVVNILVALEHNDRIRHLVLFNYAGSDMDKLLAAMQQPFPALTYLELNSSSETVRVVPASFLGGSAPQLQTLHLFRIPVPGLPKLLLSATHLVQLRILNIPHSGYFLPETIVTSLAVLTRLERLDIGFGSPRSFPDRKTRRPPPQTRTVLPVLTSFMFRGVSEYLDDLVARIDTPLLNELNITFFHQLLFDTPHLTQFVRRTPKFKAYDEARVEFSGSGVWLTTSDWALRLGISCRPSDWQLSSLAQICRSGFMPAVEHLYLDLHVLQEKHHRLSWQDDIETSQWLEVLHPLTAVKDLYICREFTPHIAPTLKELVGGRVTEALPVLQTLFLQEALPSSGPVQESIAKFVAARELAGLPVAVSLWEDG